MRRLEKEKEKERKEERKEKGRLSGPKTMVVKEEQEIKTRRMKSLLQRPLHPGQARLHQQ